MEEYKPQAVEEKPRSLIYLMVVVTAHILLILIVLCSEKYKAGMLFILSFYGAIPLFIPGFFVGLRYALEENNELDPVEQKKRFHLGLAAILLPICEIGWFMWDMHQPSKHIQEYAGEWRIIPPGKPLDKFPTAKVIEEGKGPAVGVGYLVQMNITKKIGYKKAEPTWHDEGNWWVWTGFTKKEETAFFTDRGANNIGSALIGFKEGSIFKFIATPEGPVTRRTDTGLYTNVMGDNHYYMWRKSLSSNKDTEEKVNISPTETTKDIKGLYETHLKILHICKADLKVRTVRLFDDSPVRVNTGWFSGHTTTEPREAFVDEGKVEGKCTDGRTATFQYGPMGSKENNGKGRSPVRGYFDKWDQERWKKLPVGVQLTPAEDGKKE